MKELQTQIKTYFFHRAAWLVGGVLSCILAFCYYLSSQSELENLGWTAIQLKKRQQWRQQKEYLEKKLQIQLKVADRDYIEKEVESLKFLDPELKKIQALLHSDPDNAPLKDRLRFIEGEQNRLHFREQNFQRAGGFQEVEVIQDHPVEMNRNDLKSLLARIENQPIGPFQPGENPPGLLIKKFDLLKKPIGSTEETFVINLELTKQEMVHE